jgi:hypothetical protein
VSFSPEGTQYEENKSALSAASGYVTHFPTLLLFMKMMEKSF